MKTVYIEKVPVGAGRAFIVAELSANHGGRLETALETLRAMKQAGADAVKLQTYRPESLTLDCDREHFAPMTDGIWKGRKGFELFREAMTPWEWHVELTKEAAKLGLICFSSPFDHEAVELLAGLDMPAYKIASFEITDIPLIEDTASRGRPVILSTGVAEPEDVEAALSACRRMGNEDLIVLKCTSAYPAPLEDMNLLQIPEMRKRFGVPVGLSDHTLGGAAAIAAVALGAVMVEKHFILSRARGGPDALFSMEPHEFREMVERIRQAESALGTAELVLTAKQLSSRKNRRSLFIVMDVKAGDPVTRDNVRSIRPGAGLHPRHLPEILGRRFSKDLAVGEPLAWDHLER
jgi:pseudaminic acid synthase